MSMDQNAHTCFSQRVVSFISVRWQNNPFSALICDIQTSFIFVLHISCWACSQVFCILCCYCTWGLSSHGWFLVDTKATDCHGIILSSSWVFICLHFITVFSWFSWFFFSCVCNQSICTMIILPPNSFLCLTVLVDAQ